MHVVVTRRKRFCAAHRLRSAGLSDAENARVYGRCTRVHGHNYVLDVSVALDVPGDAAALAGQPEGMVFDLGALSRVISEHVVGGLDHANIDADVPHFASGVPSTAENIALYAWARLRGALPAGTRLVSVRLRESDKNTAEVRL